MTNSRSSFLTICPSWKCTESMKPETLARTSTVSKAVKRPVYSSHSVMLFCSGCATVTVGGGGELAAGLRSQPANTLAISMRETKGTMRFMGSFLQHIAIRSCQKAMQRGDDLRALADRRGDTLDRARADVADGEDARAACLQQAAIAAGLHAGQHESLGVQRYA